MLFDKIFIEVLKMKNRIVWIDILRIIGIIGVLFMHIVGNTINTYGMQNQNANMVYLFFAYFFLFAVPLFVMISGMMFLGRRDITPVKMLNKYCLKIILIILIIGSGMILMEEVFISKNISLNIVGVIFNRIITINIWAHMWYLYLILGLYLITPVLKEISTRLDKRNYQIFLVVLFILTLVVPSICNYYNVHKVFTYLSLTCYIFYYFYGYYLYRFDVSKTYKILNYVLSILQIVNIILYINKYPSLNNLFSYTSFTPFILASSIILLMKEKNVDLKYQNIISSIGVCSLGIYVFHQVFINIIYKVLKIKLILDYPYVGLISYILIVFIASYLFTYLIRKIPIVRKYLI